MSRRRSGAAIHHSLKRFRLKRGKLMYSTHLDSRHAASHHHRSLVNRATISWHYLLLMLCYTVTDCSSLPVRCDRIVAGRRQLSGSVGRLDGTRRRWSGSFVAGNWTTLRATHASWLINHVGCAAPSTPKGGSRPLPDTRFSRSRRRRIKPTAKYFYQSSSCVVIFTLQQSSSLDALPNDVSRNMHDPATFYYAAQFQCIPSIFLSVSSSIQSFIM